MKKNQNYFINHITNTVTVTKKFFNDAALVENEKEFELMQKFKSMGLKIEVEQRKPRESAKTEKERNRQITYQMMAGYTSHTENAEELMEEFEIMKELAKESNPRRAHAMVLEWFHENCPDYGKIPEFDENLKVVLKPKAA